MNIIKHYLERKQIHSDTIGYWRKQGAKIGNGGWISPLANLGSEAYLVELGDKVRVGQGVNFYTHDGGLWVIRNSQPGYEDADIFKPIKIGNNVQISPDAMILPGVTIGDNVIIGVRAVVTKDIPSNSVVAGMPARVIKTVDEYFEKNKEVMVHTKKFNPDEKKNYLLNEVYPECKR